MQEVYRDLGYWPGPSISRHARWDTEGCCGGVHICQEHRGGEDDDDGDVDEDGCRL